MVKLSLTDSHVRTAVSTHDVPRFMNAVIADLQSAAWDRDVKLVLDASTELTARFDPEILQRALGSILARLIKDAPCGATITVLTAYEPAAGGDDDSDDARVKVEITTSASTLAVDDEAVRQFADAVHGCQGALTHDSAAGRATFTARFCGRRAGASDERRTAVVVDDDVDTQDFLGAVLRREGFNVVAANDGFDALIVVERYDPAVIFTDLMMPNMNGLDLVTRLKQARSELPVIVFSGYHETLQREARGMGLKADCILPKPMTQTDVLRALRGVVKTSKV